MDMDMDGRHISKPAHGEHTTDADTDKAALKPLLISLSVLLVVVILLTYAWHRVSSSEVSDYDKAARVLILDTTVQLIKDNLLRNCHGVTVAAKSLTYYAALSNSSTNTILLDRFMVTAIFDARSNPTLRVLLGWYTRCIFFCRNSADGF